MQQPGAFLSFTNTSSSSCHMDGYPSLEPVSATGQIIGAAIRDSGNYLITDPGPQTVTLAPGASAYFGYGWSDVTQPLGSSVGCIDTVMAVSIPPGGAIPLYATAALPSVCPGGFPSVTAVAPASPFTADGVNSEPIKFDLARTEDLAGRRHDGARVQLEHVPRLAHECRSVVLRGAGCASKVFTGRRTQVGVLEAIGVLEAESEHSIHPDVAEPDKSENEDSGVVLPPAESHQQHG